tara:strand:+ start:68 stop:175 length:108 start_codon:yes stop_codon:yes gene_type:complete
MIVFNGVKMIITGASGLWNASTMSMIPALICSYRL